MRGGTLMSEEKKRPQGRKRGKATASGQVHKREEALGNEKPVGNVSYEGRKDEDSNQEPDDSKVDRGLLDDVVAAGQAGNNKNGNAEKLVGALLAAGAAAASQQAKQNKQEQSQPQRPQNNNYGSPQRSRGGSGLLKIVLFLVCAFLLLSCLLGRGRGSETATTVVEPTPTPTVAPTPTPAPTQQATMAGTFQPVTTTYVNTNYNDVTSTPVSGVREQFTKILGNNQDRVTIMIYMCGTDLESKYGMATNDMYEMVQAASSDKVNVIVETGGTQRWQNQAVDSRTNQRWKVVNGGLQPLNQNVGLRQMTDPNTLIDFIQFGTQNFPAERYMLIFWDHGGGSVQGYGYDQNYPNSTMTVDEIAYALNRSNVKFDMIGFDACLMANAETAIAVAPYADYLIASEETEPGTGWHYTNWLSMLAQNSSTPTLTFAKTLIDDFVQASYQQNPSDLTSLSIIDLAEFDAYFMGSLNNFAKDITQAVQTNQYRAVARARSVSKEFAQSNQIDQVDLIHFAANINTQNAKNLIDTVQSFVKYNRCNNMKNAYGLSIYFPYNNPRYLNAVAQIYQNIGFNGDYFTAIKTFANLETTGQVANYQTSSSMYDLLGGAPSSNGTVISAEDLLSLLMSGSSQPSSQGISIYDLLGGTGGMDSGSFDLYSSLIGRASVDNNNLKYAQRGDTNVLVLDQDQWDLMTDIQLNVWVDDGSGYIDLGCDNVYEFDEEGNLIADYDRLWTSINDQPVSYYMLSHEYESDDAYTTTGYVPALLNGERVNLIIRFTADDIDGTVLGAQLIYEEGVEAKGLVEIMPGDKIDFVCDYYDYKGNFVDSYKMSETVTVPESGLTVGVYEILDQPVKFGYRLTDIYHAYHWTPMITLE